MQGKKVVVIKMKVNAESNTKKKHQMYRREEKMRKKHERNAEPSRENAISWLCVC